MVWFEGVVGFARVLVESIQLRVWCFVGWLVDSRGEVGGRWFWLW
jgi:hypothetical protein